MTEPNETNQTNEDLNEELSTDELKSVSGGTITLSNGSPARTLFTDTNGAPAQLKGPKGSGSGMTRDDFERYTRTDSQADGTVSDGERWMT